MSGLMSETLEAFTKSLSEGATDEPPYIQLLREQGMDLSVWGDLNAGVCRGDFLSFLTMVADNASAQITALKKEIEALRAELREVKR
jgi:hypothetical protein